MTYDERLRHILQLGLFTWIHYRPHYYECDILTKSFHKTKLNLSQVNLKENGNSITVSTNTKGGGRVKEEQRPLLFIIPFIKTNEDMWG